GRVPAGTDALVLDGPAGADRVRLRAAPRSTRRLAAARLRRRRRGDRRRGERERGHAGPASRSRAAVSGVVERSRRVRNRRRAFEGGIVMALVDERGRVAGRVNLIDGVIAAVIVVMIPLAIGAYLLFRNPRPKLTNIAPTTLYEGPNL